jgi:hypothetical protein
MKAWKQYHIFSLAVIMATSLAMASCIEILDAVLNSILTGTVSIDGQAELGQTLTAKTANLSGSGTIFYQWKRGTEDEGYITIPDTATATYVVQSADVGFSIVVTVTRFAQIGSITSEPTARVADARPTLTGRVSITGQAGVGQTLTANTDSLGGDGTVSYLWKRGTAVIGTDSGTYIVQSADAGSVITVTVTRSGNSGSVTSNPTATVTDTRPVLTGTVSITGTALVGQTLTANTANLGGSGTVSYQWKRGSGGTGGSAANIGTDSNTYLLLSFDAGSIITVTVTRSGNSGSVTGELTAIVITDGTLPELNGTVSISGQAEVGKTLTANISSLGGSGTVSYQWVRGTATNIGTDSNTYGVQPTDAGSTITVTVTRSGYSGIVTGLPTATVADTRTAIRLPYYYPGTGKTYNGFTGTEGTMTGTYGVTVTYPSETEFSADGFFTVEGSIDNPDSYNYAYISVTKTGDYYTGTTYFVRDNFKQRIWLRFGAGDYTVSISGMGFLTADIDGEGAFRSYSSGYPTVTYNVTNTRDEGDMRFIYPSYLSPSDDKMVTDLVADLTSGLTGDTEKLRALHDYLVKNTVYDQISYRVEGMRKKQDALTVLGTRYSGAPYDARYIGGHFLAVCEGYANTFTALARAAGFETRYVSSRNMNHGWNNVYVNGEWKFMDVTWNDPTTYDSSATNVVDYYGPDGARHTYFLLDTLNGVDDSHTGWEVNNQRSLGNTSTLPWQRGMPDGWY